MCYAHDLREPLAPTYQGQFDTFATDPPYTAEGAKLFVSRGLSALKRGPGRQGFLCFSHKRSDSMVDVLAALVGMWLQLDEIIPAFNDYEGASILGSSSQMIHLLTTAGSRPAVTGRLWKHIYTGRATGARLQQEVSDKRGGPRSGCCGHKKR